MVMLSAIHEATAATVLTVAAADELASSCTSSGFGQARGTAGCLLSGEATGELDWEIVPSVSVSRELVSAFSTSSLSAAALSVDALCPILASLCQKRCTGGAVQRTIRSKFSLAVLVLARGAGCRQIGNRSHS